MDVVVYFLVNEMTKLRKTSLFMMYWSISFVFLLLAITLWTWISYIWGFIDHLIQLVILGVVSGVASYYWVKYEAEMEKLDELEEPE